MPLISGGSALPTGASTLTSSATATGTIVSTFESASFTESGPPVYTTPSSCRIDPPVYTTAFVPPKDCSLQYSPYSSTNNNVNTTLFLSHNVLSASCYPSGWYPYCVELLTITPLYFYSPKSCPDGYAAATTQFDIETTSGTSTTTTILGCCESDLTQIVPTSAFGHAAFGLQSCVGNITKTLITLMYNSTSYTTQYFYSTLVNNGTTSQSYASNYSSSLFYKTTTTFVDAAEKTAYPIWVGWTGANAPTTQANIANATAAGTALPSHSPSTVAKSGLSTGASAGIGVGAGLGGLLILAAAVLGYRHRKKKLTKAEVPSHEKPELSEDATIKPKELPDVQEKRVHEADTIHPPVELG